MTIALPLGTIVAAVLDRCPDAVIRIAKKQDRISIGVHWHPRRLMEINLGPLHATLEASPAELVELDQVAANRKAVDLTTTLHQMADNAVETMRRRDAASRRMH